MTPTSSSAHDRGPAVSFPPPLLFVTAFSAGLVLSRIVPLHFPWGDARWTAPVALLLVVHGLGLMVIGILTFHRADTAVYPNRPARTLVTHGIYSRTRNPMYLGLSIAYVGGVIATGSVWALLLLPIALVLLVRLVIGREEQHLTEKFPTEYGQYCADVGRWL